MEIPQFELERLARFLLPRILKFYENEENQKAFDEWLEQRNQRSTTTGEIGMEEQHDRD
ncbi:MAG: hypothetical protein UIH27_01330 [Ruminococcus sp.]|nr:hypothetical protein [Ruminococcus sp.]